MELKKSGINTLCTHYGELEDPIYKGAVSPLYMSTSYAFEDVAVKRYPRYFNTPNQVALAKKIAALEHCEASLIFGSGMAAVSTAMLAFLSAGDHVVLQKTLYGGTYNLFAHTFPQQGIDVRMASGSDIAALEKLIDDKTKAIFCESIGNPAGNIVDLEALSTMAHKHGVPVIVDNTVATPYLCRPFEFGADIVVHSLTKYIGGHGTTIGGIIVDSGKFEWKDNPRFPQFNEPDPSYHGVVYAEALGEAAYIGRARVVPLRNMGAALSPFNAFLALQGLETLALRMDRHVANAQQVAEYLKNHKQLSWVNYAGLSDSPFYDVAQRMVAGKPSAILSFGIKGGVEVGAKFIDALQMIKRLVNIGDAKSLACHPASTTHRQLNEDELATAGVSADLVRLSIGIEHVDDIIADIEQALEAATNS